MASLVPRLFRGLTSVVRDNAKNSVLRTAAPMSTFTKPPVKVSVTGAAGAIGYALVFRIASGAMLGPDQPVILQLIELPQALPAVEGVVMELQDCAFPLLHGITKHDDVYKGFGDADYALLVGSKPRGKGMERKDLLEQNGAIFTTQGKALNASAKKSCKVLVVGNPANTNCLIAQAHAPNIPAENFTAMTRLDHNRAVAQVAAKTNSLVTDVEKICIWGNHSSTQYPDLSHTLVKGKSAKQLINDEKWIRDTFIPDVQQRGAAIIKARGASSAASAANAAIEHMRDWALGTKGQWVSMAIPSQGRYGVRDGLIFSYPVTCENGKYTVVNDLAVDAFSAEKIAATEKELLEERDSVKHLL